MPATPAHRRRKGVVSAEQVLAEVEAEQQAALSDGPQSQRYPERHLPIAGGQPRAELWVGDDSDDEPPAGAEYEAALARYDLFSHARGRFLGAYGINTARAYWGDLDDIFFWCEHRDFDIFDLTDKQLNQYVGLLRRRDYSENTIRRRRVSYRLFRKVVDAE